MGSLKLNQVGSEMIFPSFFAYVPWKHHVLIIQRCKTIEETLFYIRRVIEEGWSRNALGNSLRADLHHVSGGALTDLDEHLPMPQGKLAQELLKENYDLGFINLPTVYDEIVSEEAIEQRMTRFLLELGEGWAFIGRQKEIIISGKEYKNYCERTFFYYLTVLFCSLNAFSISASVSSFEKLMLFFSPYVLSHAGIVIFFLTALFPYFSA
jgi:predicted nuclease of restriction endonuclease-like (RecB) superfamily